MVIRRATPEDASGIAAVHVYSWQAAYRGVVPDDFLRSLSIEDRETVWRESLEDRTSEIWVADE